jgi:hypothetical protein
MKEVDKISKAVCFGAIFMTIKGEGMSEENKI